MINKVKTFAKKYDMLPNGGIILAAVSGGADSMCLLSVLRQLSDVIGFHLEAAHYNHMLRGEESQRDEKFVRQQCERMNIPCHVGAGNVKLWAKNNSIGVEEAGRKLRYEFFYQTASKIGANRIATAHNADDNCETVIMNMVRGSGLRGLCGIPPRRDLIVRPILNVSRREIEEYLSAYHIPNIEDSSNFSDDYTRNKLRHHVIPVLNELNPDFTGVIANMTNSLSLDRDYIENQAEQFIKEHTEANTISVSALAALPETIAVRVIRSLAGGTLSGEQTASVLKLVRRSSPSGQISLPGRTAVREYDALRFLTENRPAATFDPFEIHDGFYGEIPALGMIFRCNIQTHTQIIHKSFNSFLFKTDGLCGTITVRPRAGGDRLTIAGRGVTKSIKKLMIEERIPLSQRGLIPVFCDDNGVIAAVGLGQDPRTVPQIGDSVLTVTFEPMACKR